MTEFTTKGGTTLPILNLKGKPYLQVAHRIVWFREEHPEDTIETSLVQVNDDCTIAQAIIKTPEGRIRAMAHKREDKKGFQDHTEKAETGAIGRALALCGYGTQFAPEFDEGERLADSPTPIPRGLAPAPKITNAAPTATVADREAITGMAKLFNVPIDAIVTFMTKTYGKTKVMELLATQVPSVKDFIANYPKPGDFGAIEEPGAQG